MGEQVSRKKPQVCTTVFHNKVLFLLHQNLYGCLLLCELHCLAVRFNKTPFLLQWTDSKSSASISLLLHSLCKVEVNFYESIYRSAGSLKLDPHAFRSTFFLYWITNNNGLKILSYNSLWGQQSKSNISKAKAISEKWWIKLNEVWNVS